MTNVVCDRCGKPAAVQAKSLWMNSFNSINACIWACEEIPSTGVDLCDPCYVGLKKTVFEYMMGSLIVGESK